LRREHTDDPLYGCVIQDVRALSGFLQVLVLRLGGFSHAIDRLR
jgi:hypothetical protein